MDNEGLLSLEEVAGFLRMTEECVVNHLHTGSIPAVRVGPFWRFRREEVAKWAESEAVVEDRSPISVLIVEDDPLQREMLARWMHDGGAQVETAGDGLAAVQHLREHPVDLLLLDLNLPGLNGAGVLQHTKDLNAYRRVWIMTAFSQSSIMQKAFNMGPATVLRKPLVKGVLMELLQRERKMIADSAQANSQIAANA